MTGFYLMHRGWINNPVFAKEAYCERMAWVWLIERASFEPHEMRLRGTHRMVKVERGQLVTSYRVLADTWGWSVNRVRRFISLLENQGMVNTATDTLHTVITISNYGQYQSPLRKSDTAIDTPSNTLVDTVTDTQPDTVPDTRINKGNKLKEGKRRERIPSGADAPKPSAYPPLFESFWEAYPGPRRQDKPEALTAWHHAIKKATPEQLMDSLQAYATTRQAIEGFAPTPARWLKRERWAETHIPIEQERANTPMHNPLLPDQKAILENVMRQYAPPQ